METINPSSVFDELNNTMEKEGVFSSKPLSVNEDVKIEVDSWEEFAKEYSKIHSLDLEQVRYWFIPLIEFGKKNYTLTKK